MAERKTERLMNLIFALLATRQYLSKEQIRGAISDYRTATSEAAFDRMFERDKEELREMGIGVEMGSNDKFFDDEVGYRIRRDEAELPDVHLSREEAAVIGLAAQVWQHAGLASDSTAALVKLKAIGVDIDTSALRLSEPRLSASEPSFDAMWEAATQCIPISFSYQRPGGEPSERHVQPWGVISWRDRWYLGGFDLDRDAVRIFRMSRVLGEVAFTGPPGSYEVPEGTDMTKVAASLFPAPAVHQAVLRVRSGRGQALRGHADASKPLDDEWDEVTVHYGAVPDIAAEVVAHGPDVMVISPLEVRTAVIERLQAAVSGSWGGPS